MSRRTDPPMEFRVNPIDDLPGGFRTLRTSSVSVAVLAAHGSRRIVLDLELPREPNDPGSGETLEAYFELDEAIDPYILAGDLMAAGDSLIHAIAIEDGLDAQAIEQAKRRARRMAKIARRQLADRIDKAEATKCETCKRRPVSYVIDGRRFCKRCAEAAGVRPHGKIGDEQYDDELAAGRDPRD